MKIKENIVAEMIQSTVVNNYRFFYYLANEMLSKAQNDAHTINQFRYSMGTVIFSYTTIENYILHSIYEPRGKIAKYFDKMSDSLKEKLDKLPTMERLELLFHFDKKSEFVFDKGKEPLQSFELLRQLRNFIIHYKPFEEVVFTTIQDYQSEETKLEKRIKGKFSFNESESAFVYKCFSKDCAKWSFTIIDAFLDWYCAELELSRPKLENHWRIE
ncbi:MAG: hypothetical protein KJ666_04230 [Bacteroidetes bacterium]|nr:hypothetical protein [Bacteroidota bacterium]MBU2584230.1 hypothetical protein [Bacteroidota bacterium]